MNKKKGNKIVLAIVIIILLLVVSIGVYFVFVAKKNPLASFFEAITGDNKILDTYNGVYSFTEDLNDTYSIFPGCSVREMKNYILVKKDKYYTYRSSCMGTYLKNSGDIKDLQIEEDKDKKSYYIKYDGKTYNKDIFVNSIVPNNDIAEYLRLIDMNSVPTIIKETEFEGNYYDMEDLSIASSDYLKFSYYPDEKEMVLSYSEMGNSIPVYKYRIKDFNNIPKMYSYGNNFAIIEKGDNPRDSNKFAYTFLYVTGDGIMYDSLLEFPIIVDDEMLSYDSHSIFIKFNARARSYTVLVGRDKKMCDENFDKSKEDMIAYYEFEITYNYLSGTFGRPQFKKIGYMSEGCNYVNSILGG